MTFKPGTEADYYIQAASAEQAQAAAIAQYKKEYKVSSDYIRAVV